MEETSRRGIWVDINCAVKKGLTFYQTRSNAIIFQETLPAYCIPKVVRLKTKEVLHEIIHVTSTSAKDLIEARIEKENWVRKLLDNQKEKLLDKQNFSNPLQIQFVTDRGD